MYVRTCIQVDLYMTHKYVNMNIILYRVVLEISREVKFKFLILENTGNLCTLQYMTISLTKI